MCWYAMFVETGWEEYICNTLRTITRRCAVSIGFQILVPKRKLLEYSGGQQHEVIKPLFPGYIFIETEQIEILSQVISQSIHFYRLLRDNSFSPSVIKFEEMCQVLYLIIRKFLLRIKESGQFPAP